MLLVQSGHIHLRFSSYCWSNLTPLLTPFQLLSMDDGEGSAITVDVNGSTLAVGTSQAVVRLWDLARREARPIGVQLTEHHTFIRLSTLA